MTVSQGPRLGSHKDAHMEPGTRPNFLLIMAITKLKYQNCCYLPHLSFSHSSSFGYSFYFASSLPTYHSSSSLITLLPPHLCLSSPSFHRPSFTTNTMAKFSDQLHEASARARHKGEGYFLDVIVTLMTILKYFLSQLTPD